MLWNREQVRPLTCMAQDDKKVSAAAIALWVLGAVSGPVFVRNWPPGDGWGMPTWLVILLISGQFVVGLLVAVITLGKYGPYRAYLPLSWLAEYLADLRDRAIDKQRQDARKARRCSLIFDLLGYLLVGTVAMIAYPDLFGLWGIVSLGFLFYVVYLLDKVDRRRATGAGQNGDPIDHSDLDGV